MKVFSLKDWYIIYCLSTILCLFKHFWNFFFFEILEETNKWTTTYNWTILCTTNWCADDASEIHHGGLGWGSTISTVGMPMWTVYKHIMSTLVEVGGSGPVTVESDCSQTSIFLQCWTFDGNNFLSAPPYIFFFWETDSSYQLDSSLHS